MVGGVWKQTCDNTNSVSSQELHYWVFRAANMSCRSFGNSMRSCWQLVEASRLRLRFETAVSLSKVKATQPSVRNLLTHSPREQSAAAVPRSGVIW